LPRPAWNRDPSNLSCPHCLEWQAHSTVPSYWLRWCLRNSLPTLISNHDPPDLSLPSS
jgi:hypothetical protein